MKTGSSLEIHLGCSAAQALERIAAATAGEGFPFLSPARPQDRAFLSHVRGERFRLWKWPSRSRSAGKNARIPMLCGQIRPSPGGATLTASFRLHPFALLLFPGMPILFAALAVVAWFWISGYEGRALAVALLVFALFFCTLALPTAKRQKEEQELREFLERLLQLEPGGRVAAASIIPPEEENGNGNGTLIQ